MKPARWAIMFAGGRCFVGQVSGSALCPAFELGSQVVQQGGKLGVLILANPVLMLPSFDSVDIPAGAITRPLDTLSSDDQGQVMAAVTRAQGMASQMRAAQAGIVIADSIPKAGS